MSDQNSSDPKTLPLPMVLPEPPPEEFPRAFGSYLLLAPLARGGMGEVFLAKHGSVAGLEKHCVVKTLRPHLTDDREYTSRFVDEARIVVQLGHRNICHVFDVGMVGERYYLAMEYIAGKDLRALASDVGDKGGVVNPGLALHVVSETLEALDYAHRQIDASSGTPLLLVHRDVSPQNVMLSWEGEVKLIDFGLAASTLKVEQTSPNVVMGKLAYMAPEQVRGEKVDGRADLFAAAVMLYELVMGERFYEGRSPYEIWGIAAQGGYRPRGWDSVNPDMKLILDRALAGSPSARYPTGIELREDLQHYMQVRALRGDAPMLRSLMQTVYAPEIEESRRTLAVLSRARVSTRSGSVSGPTRDAFHVTTEPTVSLARSPSQSIENKRMLAAAAGEGTEPTEQMLKPTFGPVRRLPIAAAAAGLLAVAAVVAVIASRVPPAAIAPPVVAVVAPVVAPVVPVVPVIAPVVPVVPVVPVIAPVDVVPAEPEEPEEVAVSKQPRKKPKDKLEKVEKVEKVAKVDEVKVEPEVKAPAPDVAPSFASMSMKGKVAELAKRCSAQPCAASVLKHDTDWGSLQPGPLKVFKDALSACWVTCGLPP